MGKRVTVKVPASTSNLGSGFDTLGLAVNLHLTVTAEIIPSGIKIDSNSTAIATAEPLIQEALKTCPNFPHGIRIHIGSNVPVGRGLGASAALRVAVVAAANALTGKPLPKSELLQAAYALEHHPDNASPAIFGGFTVSGKIGEEVRCLNFPVNSALKLVTLIPDFEMDTTKARELLPAEYTRGATTHSLNRAALVTASFASGKYEQLHGAFDDVLHQPYRQQVLPQLSTIIQAGTQAGAIGGFLSGAGSAIICLTLENEQAISQAMQALMPNSQIQVLRPENQGLQIDNTVA